MAYIENVLSSIRRDRDSALERLRINHNTKINKIESDCASEIAQITNRPRPTKSSLARYVIIITSCVLGILICMGASSIAPMLLFLPAGFIIGYVVEDNTYKTQVEEDLKIREADTRKANQSAERKKRLAESTFRSESKKINQEYDTKLNRAKEQYDRDINRYKRDHARSLISDYNRGRGVLYWITYHEKVHEALKDAPRGIVNIRTDIQLKFDISGQGFSVKCENLQGHVLFTDTFDFHAADQEILKSQVEVIGFTLALSQCLKQKLEAFCKEERFDQEFSLELNHMLDDSFCLMYHGKTYPENHTGAASTSSRKKTGRRLKIL